MIQLGASPELLKQYQELKNGDLQTSTVVEEPNARGQRDKELSWIWKVPGFVLGSEESFTHECKDYTVIYGYLYLIFLSVFRVSWIRAMSRRDRWKEELAITSHEMVWVILWFQHRATMWRTKASQAANVFDVQSMDLRAYAYRQADNWERLRDTASSDFHKANERFTYTFGYPATGVQT